MTSVTLHKEPNYKISYVLKVFFN